MNDKMKELFQRYPALASCEESLNAALSTMEKTYRDGGTILLCGNGGSCADCDHIVGELMKGFLSLRPMDDATKHALTERCPGDGAKMAERLQRGIPAISLAAHAGVMTAFSNDVDPDLVYAQLVYAFARPHDLVMGISTSGNSKNVVAALKMAAAMGLSTVGLTGGKDCAMDQICDVTVKAPETETFKVQEYHLPIYHYLCAALEETLFEKA